MKRRNFLAALFALPFAARTVASVSGIGSEMGNKAAALFGGLFDSHKREVESNAEAVRNLTEAMRLYAPTGFKSEPHRFNASDPRPLDKLGRRMKPPEKE